VAVVAIVTVAVAAFPRVARAQDASACYDAHERSQIERRRGEWRKARASLATCGAAACPPIVQRDCVAWAGEIAAQQPSVIVAVVKEDGSDILGARVSLDGAPVQSDGRATEVDPGEHRVRVEITGEPPIEQRVAVREGERGRRVVVKVPSSGSESGRASGLPRPPTISYVLGGVSVLALGSFTVFALTGKSRENELARTCSDRCSDDEVGDVRRSYVIADISLGVAIAAAAAAVVTWLVVPQRTPATARSALLTF
jgi:hypothetical protein